MNKYKRQHTGSNTSPGIFWLLGLMAMVFLIWRMIDRYKTAKQIHAAEKRELQYKEEMRDLYKYDSLGIKPHKNQSKLQMD